MSGTTGLKRKNAPIESTWNREAVYPTWKDWKADLKAALKELPELSKYNGRLKEGPDVLADWFELRGKHWCRLMILLEFADWAQNVDSTDTAAKGHYRQAKALEGKFRAATSFARPQLLEIGETLLDWTEEEPRLGVYKHFFDNLLRLQDFQREEEVEEILSMFMEPFDGVYQAATELVDADLAFEDAVDSQGKKHPVYQANMDIALQDPDRERRRTAWESYFDGYLSMENTLASIYLANVKQWMVLAEARGYGSVLEMMLTPTKLPLEVFHNLIDTFKKNLPTWHRYWAVKAKVLGVDAMRPYDVWASTVKDPPVISYKQSVEWICESLKPLGEEYVSILWKGSLEGRWVDWAPNIEKRQNAASSLQVGHKPPFIYMSYDDSMIALSTLTHELGHSMHGVYTAENQPEVYIGYRSMSSTVGETPSNFHQAMTRAYLQELKADDRDFQLALIDEAMANYHRYFFIMPMLACFEYEVFNRAVEGQPLTALELNDILRGFYAEGYGETMEDDPARTGITWAQFLHLYEPFYTFQYAIGISAADALAAKILAGEKGMAERYINLISAGGSMYTMDLFELSGVDMSTPAPVEASFKELARLVDRLEELGG
ncbi:MAG: M3 family oligoendopeptidase [Anaerolineales bacterium]|jgi:oligoendopeptidase F